MDETGETPMSPNPSPDVPVRKVPVKATRLRERSGQPHFFTAKQRIFLDTLSRTLDYKQALKDSGLKPHQVQKSPYLMDEAKIILEASGFIHRKNAAMGNHLRLMDKFEKDYDTGPKADKPKYAGVLAKMSESCLKAAGEFGEDVEGSGASGVKVVINIGQPSQPAPRAVDVEVSDAGTQE